MRLVKLTFAALLGLAVSACIPEFDNPVTGGDPADPILVGSWSASSSGDAAEMLVDITVVGSGLNVVVRDKNGASAGETMTMAGVTGKVGDARFISLKMAEAEAGAQSGYVVFRYTEAGGKISVESLDEQKIAAAIDSGALKGTVTRADSDVSPKITASSEELAAFLASPTGADAFRKGEGDILVLTRTSP